jgi:uncharacterized protein
MASEGAFEVETATGDVDCSTLVIGQSHVGMAGVTAADYLVRNLDTTEVGHVSTAELPAVAPFEDGTPRHHSRLYGVDGTDLSVLVGELPIPVDAARGYADALLSWADDHGVDEIVALHGVPFPHGPEEHAVFYVATPAYRAANLEEEPIRPLKGGVLDGVFGELVTRSLDETAPDTAVFVTPAHPPGPDIDAALMLLDAVESLCGFEVDETELRQFGEDLKQHYEQLAERMTALEEERAGRDYPEDRMYM